jgi:hypothetical protein
MGQAPVLERRAFEKIFKTSALTIGSLAVMIGRLLSHIYNVLFWLKAVTLSLCAYTRLKKVAHIYCLMVPYCLSLESLLIAFEVL